MGTHLDPAHGLRALAVGYSALGVLGLVTEVLLGTSVETAVVVLGLLAAAGGGVLAWLAHTRPSQRALAVAVAVAVLIVSFAIAHTEEVAANAIVYLIPVAFAAYCLPARGFGLVLGLVAVGFALALDLPARGIAVLDRFILLIGSLAVASWLLVRLRRRIDGLVAELERTSVTDGLTGLLNRRGFEARLTAELAEHRRRGGSLGLLVADIDHFKATNDALGHAAGDVVLQRVARTLSGAARGGDEVARIGGEEFAVLLPDTGEEAAHASAERLRQAVRDATGSTTTISIGVGLTGGGDLPDDLMRRTDRALYVAKDLGRDRVVRAG